MKLKLDLQDIFNRGDEIERALLDVIREAIRLRAGDRGLGADVSCSSRRLEAISAPLP